MKVVLLAGGFGTRISEESHLRPKPMIEIGEKPILWHIMKQYSQDVYKRQTLRCLESILCTCEGLDYEVILADDCSTDETRRISEKVQGIHCLLYTSRCV